MIDPLLFHPIFKERVWGGRDLERLFGKTLPAGKTIGESWEIADRPGDVSVISNGTLAGKNLRWLMDHHRGELLGDLPVQDDRFPLLVKILDARQDLSLQVHPPAHKASLLAGEPKTEMWYVVDAMSDAAVYAGLKRGVTREEFVSRLKDGTVAGCFHRLAVAKGDSLFLPSGRVHALGAGNVVFEIQQNSDTTYRVFDWNRLGLDGKLRELHVAQSLESIDFNDFEPTLTPQVFSEEGGTKCRVLADNALFCAEIRRIQAGAHFAFPPGRMCIVAQIEGSSNIVRDSVRVAMVPGRFCLVPASAEGTELQSEGAGEFLVAAAGNMKSA